MEVLEESNPVGIVDEVYDSNIAQALCYAIQIADKHNWMMVTVERGKGLTASALDVDTMTVYTVHFTTPSCGDGGGATKAAAKIIAMFKLAAGATHAFGVLRKPDPKDPEHTFRSFGRQLVEIGEPLYP